MGTLFVDKLDPQSGTSLEIGSSGDTITIPSGATLDMSNGTMTLNSSMKATPAFEAYKTSSQTISTGTSTKLQYDTEVFDTDNAYDNSTNYRFTPQVAGKYFIFASVQSGNTNDFDDYQIQIYKNGSIYALSRIRHHYGDNINCQVIMDMNGSSDYAEAFVYQASGGDLDAGGTTYPRVRFGGFRIIGA
jgi:hypothetical protein